MLFFQNDIKNADTTVRHAYKYYVTLKAALSKKPDNVSMNDNFNETSADVDKSEISTIDPKADLDSVKHVEKEKHIISQENGVVCSKISDLEAINLNQTSPDPVLNKVKNSLLSIFSETSNPEHGKPLPKPKKDVIPVFNNGSHLKELTSKLCALQNQVSPSAEPEKLNTNTASTSKKDEPTLTVDNENTNNASTEVNDVPDLPTNVKNVWGNHLNKTNIKNTAVKKLRERTSSFHFTQKLFSSSTFKTKRNPLKPHVPLRRSKSECFSLFNESSCDSLDTIPTPSTSSVATQEIQEPEPELPTEEVITPSTLQLFSNTKCKVVIKESTQPKAAFQTVSRITTESRHSLDAGWLNRCTQPAEDSIVDIFAQDRLISKKPKIMSQSTSKSSRKNENNATELSQLPEETPAKDNTAASATASETCIKTDTSHVSIDLHHNFDTSENVNSDLDPFADDDNDVVSDSDTEQPQESFLMNRLPKRSASEALSPLPLPAEKKVKVQKVEEPSKAKSAKQESLEKKISQGRINENFVKINIKKKVFVRGRKNTSYSKYKKMMYKKKQVGQGGSGYSTKGACFTCGEVRILLTNDILLLLFIRCSKNNYFIISFIYFVKFFVI